VRVADAVTAWFAVGCCSVCARVHVCVWVGGVGWVGGWVGARRTRVMAANMQWRESPRRHGDTCTHTHSHESKGTVPLLCYDEVAYDRRHRKPGKREHVWHRQQRLAPTLARIPAIVVPTVSVTSASELRRVLFANLAIMSRPSAVLPRRVACKQSIRPRRERTTMENDRQRRRAV
jgi:hypothetical protein